MQLSYIAKAMWLHYYFLLCAWDIIWTLKYTGTSLVHALPACFFYNAPLFCCSVSSLCTAGSCLDVTPLASMVWLFRWISVYHHWHRFHITGAESISRIWIILALKEYSMLIGLWNLSPACGDPCNEPTTCVHRFTFPLLARLVQMREVENGEKRIYSTPKKSSHLH